MYITVRSYALVSLWSRLLLTNMKFLQLLWVAYLINFQIPISEHLATSEILGPVTQEHTHNEYFTGITEMSSVIAAPAK